MLTYHQPLTAENAHKRGLGRGITHPSNEPWHRLAYIPIAVTLQPGAEVEAFEQRFHNDSEEPKRIIVEGPARWTMGSVRSQPEPFHASIRPFGKREISFAWVVFDENGKEHNLTGLEMKQVRGDDDDDLQFLIAAQYGGVETTCIRCPGGHIICGVEPDCV
jgi:hypothetical protein